MTGIGILTEEGALVWNLPTIVIVSIAAAVFFLVSLFLLILKLVKDHKKKNEEEEMKLNASNVRICIYNMANSTVRYFDKNDMRHQKVTTIQAFYSSFAERSDGERVKAWIQGYLNSNGSQYSFLTAKSHIESSGKECLSIYRITDYDAKNRIIHFENTLLPAISIQKSRRSNELSYVKKLSDVQAYACGRKAHPCVCYYIVLIPYVNGTAEKFDTQRTLYVTSIYQPLNNIQKYLNKKRSLVLVDDKNAAIFDFGPIVRTEIISFCNTLMGEIQRYFSIKDLSDLYQIDIGVSIYQGKETFESALSRAETLAQKAAQTENISYLIEGEPDAEQVSSSISSSMVEISALITNRTFRCYFTPVLSLKLASPTYLGRIVPYGTSLTSFAKLLEVAKEAGKGSELLKAGFAGLAEGLDKTNPQKVILILPYALNDLIIEVIKEMPDFKKSLIIGFDMEEVQDFYEADIDVEKTFQTITDLGIPLCLSFTNADIDSPKEVIDFFSLFILSLPEQAVVHGNEQITSQLISSYSALKPFGKPIIVEGLNSAADVILAAGLGFSCFVSQAVAGSSSIPYVDHAWEEEVYGDAEEKEKAKKALKEDTVKDKDREDDSSEDYTDSELPALVS